VREGRELFLRHVKEAKGNLANGATDPGSRTTKNARALVMADSPWRAKAEVHATLFDIHGTLVGSPVFFAYSGVLSKQVTPWIRVPERLGKASKMKKNPGGGWRKRNRKSIARTCESR